MIRVLLVDDHEAIRQGLRTLFSSEPGVAVIEDVADGDEAVRAAAALTPDVIVMDLSMPTGGLEAMRRIRASDPSASFVVLTRHGDTAFVREAFASGATGYILKQSPFAELARAVKSVAAGQPYLDTRLSEKFELGDTPPPVGKLTDREAEVLKLAVRGAANKEVACELRIAVKTVEVHKSNAMRKLGLKDRSDLIRYALVEGWLQDE